MVQIMITPDGIIRINVEKEADLDALRITGTVSEAKEGAVTEKVSQTVARKKRSAKRKRSVYLTKVQSEQLVHDYLGGGLSVKKVAERYGVSPSTAWRYIAEADKNVNVIEEEEDDN